MMRFSELDLSQPVEATVWEGAHLWVTILVIIIGVLLFAGGAYYFIFLDRLRSSFWGGLILAILGVVVSTCAANISGFVYPLNNTPQENSLTRTEKIQVWANETYAIELSKKDAKVLYSEKHNYDTNAYAGPTKTGAIVDYYTDEIIIHLIKSDGEWKLFSNDKALPTTGETK